MEKKSDRDRGKPAERSEKEGKEIGYSELVWELITIGMGYLEVD